MRAAMRMGWYLRPWLLAAGLVGACGGGDSGGNQPIPPGLVAGSLSAGAPANAPASTPGNASSARPASPGAPSAAGAVEPGKEAVLEQVRKRPFLKDDFAEGEANRDPFRSFLQEFSSDTGVTAQYRILMPKYTLDELQLVAIAGPSRTGGQGGQGAHGAMFRDPTGAGEWVTRGDHVSRSDARVARIASDRVVFEMKEDLGGGRTRTVERVLELHAGEASQEGR